MQEQPEARASWIGTGGCSSGDDVGLSPAPQGAVRTRGEWTPLVPWDENAVPAVQAKPVAVLRLPL